MYVDITDRELEPCLDFYNGKEVYHKNGNGCWYHLIVIDSSDWHTVSTVNGPERFSGKKCRSFDKPHHHGSIYQENELFVLNKNQLELPPSPCEIYFGEEKIDIKSLSKKELESIGRRWTTNLISKATL